MGYFEAILAGTLSLPWLEFIKTLFDLLKGIAWPLTLAVIVYWFRSDIRSVLPRLREAGPTGVKLDPAEEQQRSASRAVAATGTVELKELPGRSRTPAIADVERRLHQEIENIPEHERLDVLTYALAQAQLIAAFERIYRLIFGSQILGLRRLNEREAVTLEEARQFYDEAAKGPHPKEYADYPFEGWLSFLREQGLVSVEGNMVRITDLGRDFLFFLTAFRLPEDKPL